MLEHIPLYRFNEYGLDGGPAAKALGPKYDVFAKRVQSQVTMQLPDIEVRISHCFPLPLCVCFSFSVVPSNFDECLKRYRTIK